MKRVKLALGSIFLSQILPLVFKPGLILSNKNLVLMIANAAIWMTQPPISKTETEAHKNEDKYSVLIIIVLSMVSVISPVVEWAYINDPSKTNLPVTLIGIVLLLVGIILRVWSIQKLGKHFTATVQIKENHALITSGPYAIVRHPSYLGALVAITGCAVFLNSYIGILVAIICMLYAYYIRIGVEEKVLVHTFGPKYENYQKKVKKLIPFIW